MTGLVPSQLPYTVVLVLLGAGLYLMLDRNLIKKVIGLNLFQTAIFLFFILSAVRIGGRPPILGGPGPYANPLPHVLILTAIVVGVAVTAVSLGFVVRLSNTYGTVVEDELREAIDE